MDKKEIEAALDLSKGEMTAVEEAEALEAAWFKKSPRAQKARGDWFFGTGQILDWWAP